MRPEQQSGVSRVEIDCPLAGVLAERLRRARHDLTVQWLDRIASRRAPEYIMESILDPSKDIDPDYEAVTVVTMKGKAITGLRVNESNFSIQLREENGKFHSFQKSELESVTVLKKSLMPDNMAEVLTVKELHDLFAFLMTLE